MILKGILHKGGSQSWRSCLQHLVCSGPLEIKDMVQLGSSEPPRMEEFK